MSVQPMPSPRGTNKAVLYIKPLAQAAPSPEHGLVRDEMTPGLRRKLAENLFASMREHEDRTMARDEMNRPKRMSDIAKYAAAQTIGKGRMACDEYDGQDLQDLVAWRVP